MRVLYDFQIFATQRRGGITRYFVELLRHLTAHKDFRADVSLGFHEAEEAGSLRALGVVRGPSSKTSRFPGSFRLNRYLTELQAHWRSYSVYHPTYYRVFRHQARKRRWAE